LLSYEKQPRCPITDEWIKKMWYLYTMDFYSATKKNEILLFAGKWMELETPLSEDMVQKAKSCMFSSYIWNIDLVQILQYYEKWATLKGGHKQEREGKE
jgi:hypothetical protein